MEKKILGVTLAVLCLSLLPRNSYLLVILIAALSLFLVALLIITVIALVTDLKIYRGFGLFREKGEGKDAASFATVKYKDIDVNYAFPLNGGGIVFSYEFVHLVSRKIGKVGHVYEYCAGPGFIGFSLLAHGLCDRLTLSDVNPKAVEAVKQTIKQNHLEDRVAVYQSDCLDSIPESEHWDLVVSNPPWSLAMGKDIKVSDNESRVHLKFYQDIGKHLNPDGSILFIEGGEYTRAGNFKGMIEKNGLKIVEAFRPVSVFGIFSKIKEYQGFRWVLVIFLRLSLALRDAYFIWCKK